MTDSKPLRSDLVAALMEFAGIAISTERTEQLALDSQAVFADVNRVSSFMAPQREVGLAVQFAHLSGRDEGR